MKFIKEGMAFIEEHTTKKVNLINLYFCLILFTTSNASFKNKKEFCLRLIENIEHETFNDIKPFYISLAMVEAIMKITHGGQ